jgi:hypothetical protein
MLALLLGTPAAHAAGQIMFPSPGVSDKPQSKLWHHAGSWWAAMNGADRIGIYELVSFAWIERDSVGPPAQPILMGGTTDVLWDGSSVYIAAYDSVAARLYKYAWVDSTRDYVPQPGFPRLIPTGAGSETIAITKDGAGRLWSVCETNFNIEVRYTTVADTVWAGPIVLGTLVAPDDIAAIVTVNGQVGVLWSNQSDWAFYFRAHLDGDAPEVWSAQETVLEGVQLSDDHISLAADASGRVFASLKDQFDRLILARRNLDATWTTNMDVQYGNLGTRPIVLIDDAQSKVYVFYTRWPTGGHVGINWIEYRVADYNTLVFGVETVFIGDGVGVSMNNAQGTKQSLPAGSLLVICDGNDGNAYWNGWGPISGIGGTGGGGQLPAPPSAPAAPLATRHTAPGGGLGHAAWAFDEASGPTSADLSGRGHTLWLGTAPGADTQEPEWTSGLQGAALRFNGINDVCTVPDASDLRFGGGFTVECWVRLLSEPDKMGLVNKGATNDRNYRLMIDRGGDVNFSFKDVALGEHEIVAPAAIVDLEWHHVAGVRDTVALEMRLYVDGQLKAFAPDTWRAITSNAPVYVGARHTSALKDYVHGYIDQVRIAPGAAYSANFSPPVTFTTRPTNYLRLTWIKPTAQGGIAGYNVFRSINGAPLESVNGSLLVASTQYTDASARDGLVTYTINAVDLIGQQSPQSPPLVVEFESYDPLPPAEPRAYAVSRHTSVGGIVAAYPLDEGSGQTVLDAAGNHYNGVLGSSTNGENADPTWTSGISGGALEFNGSGDYVTIPDVDGLRMLGSMTIEAWFKPAQLGRTGVLVGKGGSDQRNYRMLLTSSNRIEFTWDTTTGSSRKLTSSTAIANLDWHHVSCVFDAAAGRMRIYLDGVLAGSSSASGTPISGGDPLLLGARRSSSSVKDFFKGRVDLVQIASSALRTEDFTPPTGLGSTAAGGYVTLRWSLPEYGLVYGYNVYRSTNGQIDWLLNRTGLWTATEYTDEGPHPGENCYWVRAVNAHGVEGVATQVTCVSFAPDETSTDVATAPGGPGLRLRVAPNPFNPATRVGFHLERPGSAELQLFDVAGRRVWRWTLRELAAGDHSLPLAVEAHGRRLASGIYLLRLRAAGREEGRRLVVLK